MSQICCEHPRVIVNPSLPFLFAKYQDYSMFGKFFKYRKVHRHSDDFDFSGFSPRRHNVSPDVVDKCFVFDRNTGDTFPMYIVVPCNHCDICKVRCQNEFVQRCRLESQSYDFLPYFVTFTYRDSELPPDGVSVRDCQLFLKRLRINLERSGYKDKIRYVLVSEYGTLTHRPHYHGIFWNIHSTTTEQYNDVCDIFNRSWQHGFIVPRLVGAKDDNGFYYTAKYMRKDCVVPPGSNPTFMLSSRGHGGIGSAFLDSVAGDIRKNLDTSFKFLDKWSGRLVQLNFSPYILNRIFPTFSRSVSSSFRKVVRDIMVCARCLKSFGDTVDDFRIRIAEGIKNKFSDYFYLGDDTFTPRSWHGFMDYVYRSNFDMLLVDYRKMLPRYSDASFMNYYLGLDNMRKAFLGKMFLVPREVDISSMAYNCHVTLARPSPNEVF